ncbi:unnamed protein product [Symbiodinium necroappetens]|uniref:Cytochrome b5 heme-binding domain-containing protein n=1 Tax=Symbiodinium necroappetens TaxID=1628268 RepID=A0A813BWD8_9DINO|nr:unnamed protein product [Symbiodinium necroappetens]
MPRPREKLGWWSWLQGLRTRYSKVPNTVTVDQYVQTGVVTERPRWSPSRVLRRPPTSLEGDSASNVDFRSPEYRARVTAAKMMGTLKAKEPSQVHLDQSLYGSAFVLPQLARSAGWPKELTVLVIKSYFLLLLNYVAQFAILYMIAKEEMIWDLFSGQMFLCDFGTDSPSCPDGPNCIGPGGTVFTSMRYYSWNQWVSRTFARDSMRAVFPEKAADIGKYVDPGEYGVESKNCRILCCMLFIVSVLDDVIGTFNMARVLIDVPTRADLWIDYEPPGESWASKDHAKTIAGKTEIDFVKLKIAGMPLFWKIVNIVIILLPKMILWKVTAQAGICFLMETQGIEDVVVNAVGLSFILQIDELLCLELMPWSAVQILHKLEVHLLGEIQEIESLDHLSDEELFAKNQEQIDNSWSVNDIYEMIPVKMVVAIAIASTFIYHYYYFHCVRNEAGGSVSHPMALPKGTDLPLLSAYLLEFVGFEHEDSEFWTMPSAARANKIETMDEQMAYAMAEFGDYGECFVAEEPEVRTISMEEVAKHSSPEDCWVVLYGRVYDLTKFALGHVGGSKLITDLAGKDGTNVFEASHGENVLNSIRGECCVGEVDASTVLEEHRVTATLRARSHLRETGVMTRRAAPDSDGTKATARTGPKLAFRLVDRGKGAGLGRAKAGCAGEEAADDEQLRNRRSFTVEELAALAALAGTGLQATKAAAADGLGIAAALRGNPVQRLPHLLRTFLRGCLFHLRA